MKFFTVQKLILCTYILFTVLAQDPSCISDACTECSADVNICEGCKENFTLEDNKCLCQGDNLYYNGDCLLPCPEKQYMDLKTQSCLECFFYQESCVKECPSNTTANGKLCEAPKPLNTSMVLIIAVIGIVLVCGGLLYNYKSKSLSYKNIEGQDPSSQRINEDDDNKSQINEVIDIEKQETTSIKVQEVTQNNLDKSGPLESNADLLKDIGKHNFKNTDANNNPNFDEKPAVSGNPEENLEIISFTQKNNEPQNNVDIDDIKPNIYVNIYYEQENQENNEENKEKQENNGDQDNQQQQSEQIKDRSTEKKGTIARKGKKKKTKKIKDKAQDDTQKDNVFADIEKVESIQQQKQEDLLDFNEEKITDLPKVEQQPEQLNLQEQKIENPDSNLPDTKEEPNADAELPAEKVEEKVEEKPEEKIEEKPEEPDFGDGQDSPSGVITKKKKKKKKKKKTIAITNQEED